jgi:hypothetical protein
MAPQGPNYVSLTVGRFCKAMADGLQTLLISNQQPSHASSTVPRLLSRRFTTFSPFCGSTPTSSKAARRLDSNFFQGCAKVLEEQVEVPIVQTLISGPGMGIMNIFPCVYPPAEKHGN